MTRTYTSSAHLIRVKYLPGRCNWIEYIHMYSNERTLLKFLFAAQQSVDTFGWSTQPDNFTWTWWRHAWENARLGRCLCQKNLRNPDPSHQSGGWQHGGSGGGWQHGGYYYCCTVLPCPVEEHKYMKVFWSKFLQKASCNLIKGKKVIYIRFFGPPFSPRLVQIILRQFKILNFPQAEQEKQKNYHGKLFKFSLTFSKKHSLYSQLLWFLEICSAFSRSAVMERNKMISASSISSIIVLEVNPSGTGFQQIRFAWEWRHQKKAFVQTSIFLFLTF